MTDPTAEAREVARVLRAIPLIERAVWTRSSFSSLTEDLSAEGAEAAMNITYVGAEKFDPTRQTCKACGRPDKFDFHVPDTVWTAVVPAELTNRVVCLGCFDGFACEKGVAYGSSLTTLFFAGDQAAIEFKTARASGR